MLILVFRVDHFWVDLDTGLSIMIDDPKLGRDPDSESQLFFGSRARSYRDLQHYLTLFSKF